MKRMFQHLVRECDQEQAKLHASEWGSELRGDPDFGRFGNTGFYWNGDTYYHVIGMKYVKNEALFLIRRDDDGKFFLATRNFMREIDL